MADMEEQKPEHTLECTGSEEPKEEPDTWVFSQKVNLQNDVMLMEYVRPMGECTLVLVLTYKSDNGRSLKLLDTAITSVGEKYEGS